MSRAILHIDLDAFYASVEQRDDPGLKGKPVIVGGHPTRGVVLAASYEVRPFGVRSAMPMAQALRQAPQAIVVRPRFEAYAQASERVFEIFESFTPLIEPLSLDEAFLDVTASVSLLGTPADMAKRIRARIASEVGLPASAGIAGRKMVAKIASDLAKPNGQVEVPDLETRSFLAPLPVTRLWGVGPKLNESLRLLGLTRVGQLAQADPVWLVRELGSTGRHLWALSHGLDDREVVADSRAKSIRAEDTFDEDLEGKAALLPYLHAQAERVARRLRRAGVKAGTVQLKLKAWDYSVQTRQCSPNLPTDDGKAIYEWVVALLERAPLPRRLRLTGVSAHGLTGDAAQRELFAPPPGPRDRLNAALDGIARRFGDEAIITADLKPHTKDSDQYSKHKR